MVDPSSAKTMGTRWGAPSRRTVARCATRTDAMRARAWASSTGRTVAPWCRRPLPLHPWEALEVLPDLVDVEQTGPPIHDDPVGADQVQPRLGEVAVPIQPVRRGLVDDVLVEVAP